jgi:hypothetical protein
MMRLKVATANRLRDGLVVYLAGDGGWSEAIGEGRVAGDEAGASLLMEAAARAVDAQEVVEPYLMEVAADDAGLRPLRLRERIRAAGPTVQTALNRSRIPG